MTSAVLESVRKVYEGLQSLRSMRRMEASRRNASALSVRFSTSFARRRQRFSQAIVRSTNPAHWQDLARAPAGRGLRGAPVSRGALYLMLKNRIYRGEIVHKGK